MVSYFIQIMAHNGGWLNIGYVTHATSILIFLTARGLDMQHRKCVVVVVFSETCYFDRIRFKAF